MASKGMNQSDPATAREPRLKAADPYEDIFEMLERDTKTWQQAALDCERAAAYFPSGEKEDREWRLLSAVYRERADVNARLIERLRRDVSAEIWPNFAA